MCFPYKGRGWGRRKKEKKMVKYVFGVGVAALVVLGIISGTFSTWVAAFAALSHGRQFLCLIIGMVATTILRRVASNTLVNAGFRRNGWMVPVNLLWIALGLAFIAKVTHWLWCLAG